MNIKYRTRNVKVRSRVGHRLARRSLGRRRVPTAMAASEGCPKKKEVDMGIISWIILGLIVGVIAKFIMPGKDPGGIIITSLIGIGGGLVGGYIGSYLGLGTVTGFNIGSILLAVGGAVLLLILYRVVKR